jgi:wobble nucleotide-excising tRNase
MTFYDYDSNTIEVHERSIQFLLLEYVNEENQVEIEIRQFKSSVREFNGYVLEEKLSKEVTKYIKNNDDFIKELRNTVGNNAYKKLPRQ